MAYSLEIASESTNPKVARLAKKFPYKVNEDGSCSKLGEDGRCTVYDNRPILCNQKKLGAMLVDWIASGGRLTYPQKKALGLAFYQASARACNALIESNPDFSEEEREAYRVDPSFSILRQPLR